MPVSVNIARYLPFGDEMRWLNGPRERRWSVHSSVSTERIVEGAAEFGDGEINATV